MAPRLPRPALLALLALLAMLALACGAPPTAPPRDADVDASPDAPATRATIDVTPMSAGIACGGAQVFTATSRSRDGRATDITATAQWTSSDPRIATIDAQGVARAVLPGATAIRAAL